MRFFATSTMLTLALYCGGVAGQIDSMDSFDDPLMNLRPTSTSGLAAKGIALSGSRCDSSKMKKVAFTESGLLDTNLAPGFASDDDKGQLYDGCRTPWGSIEGTRRERGNVYPTDNSNDDVEGQYTVCDQTKVTVKGDGVQGPDNATLAATSTIYAEESRLALSHSVTAVNKKAGYSAPLHAVYNYYVGDSGDFSTDPDKWASFRSSYCSNGAFDEEGEITCSVDAGDSNDGLTRSLGFNIENYTNGTYKNVKAVLTFSFEYETAKLYLPKGSARIPLLGIAGSNKVKAGQVIKSKTITLPLLSRTVGPLSRTEGYYDWNNFVKFTAPTAGSTVTLTVTSGKDEMCTAKKTFT